MQVTRDTDRIGLFVAKFIGEPTDENRTNLIRWNIQHFADNPTYWLDVDLDLNTNPPGPPTNARLLLRDDAYLDAGGDRYIVVR